MQKFNRCVPLDRWAEERSYFVFGPRQTGKSTMLRDLFPEARWFNLFESDTFRELARRPEIIRKTLKASDRFIVIDEIQRLPGLLNEVQVMIDAHPRLRFLLTGSSQRSLRRKGTNMLAGRARVMHLHPLVWPEAGLEWWAKRLHWGGLPGILQASDPRAELNAYVGTYLQEEVRVEGAVRSMESFARVMDVAGLCNGDILNFTKIGDDAAVPPRLVREYFQLIEDTLIGFQVPPFQGGKKRKPVSTAKFYFFDTGVAHRLMDLKSLGRGTPAFGDALEHFIALELRAWLSYTRSAEALEYWRTLTHVETDFVIGGRWAIEVKAAARVADRDLKGLRQIAEEASFERRVIVCLEPQAWQTDDGIEVMPVTEFLADLWSRPGMAPAQAAAPVKKKRR